MVDGENENSVEMDTTQAVSYPRGVEDYRVGSNASGQGSDGYVSGNEWEKKWANGVQRRQKNATKSLDIKVDEVVSRSSGH
jgi:hypothetical protein